MSLLRPGQFFNLLPNESEPPPTRFPRSVNSKVGRLWMDYSQRIAVDMRNRGANEQMIRFELNKLARVLALESGIWNGMGRLKVLMPPCTRRPSGRVPWRWRESSWSEDVAPPVGEWAT